MSENDESRESETSLLEKSPASVRKAESATSGKASDFEKQLAELLGFNPAEVNPIIHFIVVTLTVLQWWFFNIAVIIINKWIFQKYDFVFPLTLTVLHFLVSWGGAYFFIKVLKTNPLIEVKPEDRLPRIAPLAAVTCFNIVLGNVSLRYIPVSFVQTIKALCPATTVLLQVLFWSKSYPQLIYVSLIPIVGGMMLASITELSFVWAGFLAALTSCFVTSVGVILADLLLSGRYKFDSINTVYHMIPYSFFFLLPFAILFESYDVYVWTMNKENALLPFVAIITSGVLAFGLNFSLYAVIKVTSAVTFTVVGNFKVAVAVLSSWLVFRNPMNFLNILGCGITIGGCTYYGFLQQQFSQKKSLQGQKEESQPEIEMESQKKSPGKKPQEQE